MRNKHFQIPFRPPEPGTLPEAWSPESSWTGIWELWGTLQCLFSPPAGWTVGHHYSEVMEPCPAASTGGRAASILQSVLNRLCCGVGRVQKDCGAQPGLHPQDPSAPVLPGLTLHPGAWPRPRALGPDSLSSFVRAAGANGKPRFDLLEITEQCLAAGSQLKWCLLESPPDTHAPALHKVKFPCCTFSWHHVRPPNARRCGE